MRKILYKIFPDSWIPYILHTRPRAWFIVSAHMSVGFILANGLDFTGDRIQKMVISNTCLGNIGQWRNTGYQ